MKKTVSDEQRRHNISLWYAAKSQELISGYVRRFTMDRTAQELLENRAFEAYISTNTATDFVWQVFAKRHILAAARNMGLYGKCNDGRWCAYSLEPEDAAVKPDIHGRIESQERCAALKIACECLSLFENEVLAYYFAGANLTDVARSHNMPYMTVYTAFRTALRKITQNLAENGYEVVTDTRSVLANVRTFSHSGCKRSNRRSAACRKPIVQAHSPIYE